MNAADVIQFYNKLGNLKLTWPAHFCKWIESEKGRVRSLVATMELCMLKPVRTIAGLGCQPNKWDNNVTEALHRVMKEQINNNSVDLVSFLEKIKTNFLGSRWMS